MSNTEDNTKNTDKKPEPKKVDKAALDAIQGKKDTLVRDKTIVKK